MPRNSVVSGHALMKDACTVPGSRLKKGEAICFSEETPVMCVFYVANPCPFSTSVDAADCRHVVACSPVNGPGGIMDIYAPLMRRK